MYICNAKECVKSVENPTIKMPSNDTYKFYIHILQLLVACSKKIKCVYKCNNVVLNEHKSIYSYFIIIEFSFSCVFKCRKSYTLYITSSRRKKKRNKTLFHFYLFLFMIKTYCIQ